jgi:transcriptional regulator with XRE-family HTH domain
MGNKMGKFLFGQWLEITLQEHELTQSQLARMAGVTRGAINGILSGARGPGPELCLAIAKALNIPPEEIFREAGLLPFQPDKDNLVELITHLSEQLPTDEEKEDVAIYIRHRLQIAEKRGKYETKDKNRTSKS